jgi:hypothetical protein
LLLSRRIKLVLVRLTPPTGEAIMYYGILIKGDAEPVPARDYKTQMVPVKYQEMLINMGLR